MKTLIADDDAVSIAILEPLLRKAGFDPITATDGEEAWHILQQPDAPRLILLDWNMPSLNGTDICRRIRQRKTSDPPYIIILSVRDKKPDIVEGFAAGISDYITKPFYFEELQARLNVGKRTLELQTSLIKTRGILMHQAMYDHLTGVLNRRAIFKTLEKELSRLKREHLALNIGLYDLDHFKTVNDSHGHQIGDVVLADFAKRLITNTRDYTAIGRYGGEEFLILVTGQPDQLTTNIHQRLCRLTADTPFDTPVGPMSVTVSVGVATANKNNTLAALFASADKALYTAKQSGRNRVCIAE